MGRRCVVGMDVGGTKIEGSLISEDGEVLATLREPALQENEAMLRRITDMVEALAAQRPIDAVGFSIPGSLDPSGILRNAPNSPAIQATPLAADLRARLARPLVFENDANCLVLSEHAFGAARGYRHVVGLILGTGVGGGVLIDGRLLHGSRGLAPEVGHMPLDMGGRRCKCGNLGCVEAYLSGPSLLRRYHEGGGDSTVDNTRHLFEREGDAVAAGVVAETAYLFSRFVAGLISLYDPEIFVLGGGLSLQPLFYEQEARIAEFSFGTTSVPPVVAAARGDASGKLGAAALALGLG